MSILDRPDERVSCDCNIFVRGASTIEVVETHEGSQKMGFSHMVHINQQNGPASATIFLNPAAFEKLYQQVSAMKLAQTAERIATA